ncbi:MAG: GNAT family N-acetyltransferase [Ginsengibacter sp.]
MNTIRLARPSDAAPVLAIYAPYILDTTFTFETEIPSIANFEHRIISYQENWPWLVYETEGVITGYAYATKHRERAAYQWCVESSVYVNTNYQQRGIAKALYTTLFKILQFQGCRNVYAGITLPNDKSVAFHKRFGFTWLADYKNIGYKLDKWNTVSWWELQLNDYNDNPAAPIKFPGVDSAYLNAILK